MAPRAEVSAMLHNNTSKRLRIKKYRHFQFAKIDPFKQKENELSYPYSLANIKGPSW
jgi:hypothetical protein